VCESEFGRDLEQRHGFKRDQQAKGFFPVHAPERSLNLVAGMLAGAKILTHIEGHNVGSHNIQ
jgi:hypothetical protein